MNKKTLETIKNQITNNPVILYMKGTPDSPKCGFSAKAARLLSNYLHPFIYIDVLTNLNIRAELPKFSHWPTFPQLWVDKKLIGGLDIMLDMHHNGKLKEIINQAILKYQINK